MHCIFVKLIANFLIFQEIEPKVGEELCRLFPVDENIDLISILRSIKKSKSRSSRSREDRDRHERRRGGHSSSRRSPPDSLRLATLPTWQQLSKVGLFSRKCDLLWFNIALACG